MARKAYILTKPQNSIIKLISHIYHTSRSILREFDEGLPEHEAPLEDLILDLMIAMKPKILNGEFSPNYCKRIKLNKKPVLKKNSLGLEECVIGFLDGDDEEESPGIEIEEEGLLSSVRRGCVVSSARFGLKGLY